MKHAVVCAYELPDDTSEVRLERCKQRDGSYKWAVRRGGACMNIDGEFEYEPMPSSRDNAFLARCRFDSAESAYAAWELTHNVELRGAEPIGEASLSNEGF